MSEIGAILERNSPVLQQKVLEMLVTKHCARMGNRHEAIVVAEGVHKHIKQLINQWFTQEHV